MLANEMRMGKKGANVSLIGVGAVLVVLSLVIGSIMVFGVGIPIVRTNIDQTNLTSAERNAANTIPIFMIMLLIATASAGVVLIFVGAFKG